MSINWDDFKKEIKEEKKSKDFTIKQLDHEINVLLEQRQAIMAKDVNPLVVEMDDILDSLTPGSFGGEYLYKSNWYKNLDLESWGIYKYLDVGSKEGLDENTILVDSLNGISAGSELLIEIDTGDKVPRTVESTEYSDYYEKYLVHLKTDDTTWDRKYMPDALYPKCIDNIDEKACIATNPCTDDFYKLPQWDEDLPATVESDTIPLKVLYGVGPYTWTIISGEDDGWSLKDESTNDGYNTLYSENTCNIPAIINVTDYCGNTTDEYTVTNTLSKEISLSAPSVINQGDSYIVTVIGGSAPFQWDIKEQSSIDICPDSKCVSLQYTSTSGSSNIILTENSACGSIIIRVKDKCGLIAQCETEIYDTFEYKKIYYTNYDTYYGKWLSSHYYPDITPSKPYLIPVRCIYSGNFSIKWLEQPKLEEVSNLLYSTYYDPNPYRGNPGVKWTTFSECGSIPNEVGEKFEKEDIVIDHSIPGSRIDVGYYPDYTTANYHYVYTNNNNYKVGEYRLAGGGSGCCYGLSSDGPCAWSETILPYEVPFECVYYTIFNYYSTNFLEQTGTVYSRAITSALASVLTDIYNNGEMTKALGYFPYYSYGSHLYFNQATDDWLGTNKGSDTKLRTAFGAAPKLNGFLLEKKMCKTSNYIWKAENFGDEPELIHIQTF